MTRQAVIVCATDFSDNAALALGFAAWIAGQWDGRLVVVTVVDPLLAEAARIEGFTSLRADTARALEQWIAAHAPAPPARIETQVLEGRPHDEIHRCARTEQADLVVIGTQGLTGYRRLILGSIARKVLRRTDRPVLVVPSSAASQQSDIGAWPDGSILAPVDLDRLVFADIRAAAATATALKLPLVLMYVASPPTRIPGLAEAFAKRHEAALEIARANLERLEVPVGPASLHLERMVLTGAPAEEIARVAEQRAARLIVMGLGGAEPDGEAPGSIAYRVLATATAAVLALPGRPEAQARTEGLADLMERRISST